MEEAKLQNRPDSSDSEGQLPSDSQEKEARHLTGRKLYLLLASLYLSVFCLAMDKTMLSPALGSITAEFKTVKDIGWYTSSYLLTAAATQSLYGTIYKLFDTKPIYVGAVALFEVGSLIAALAPTSSVLIIGRAVCGLGSAGIASGTYVILAQSLPLRKRAKFFGLLGAVWGLASSTGPLLGGFFAGHLTWRWCFYINLPIGCIAILVLLAVFPGNEKRNASDERGSFVSRLLQLDIAGAAALMPAILMLLLALQWGGTKFPWASAPIMGLFVGSGALTLIFAGIQLRLQDRGLLPPRFFKNRDVCFAMFFSFFFGASYFEMVPYLSLFFQSIQGVSAAQAGIRILPLSLSAALSSIVSGTLIGALGTYNIIMLVETSLITLGTGLISTFSLDTPMSRWLGYEIIMGLGLGVGFQGGLIVVQNVLSYDFIPQATANVQFFQTLGGAVSVAAAQAAFQNGIVGSLERDAPQVSPALIIDTGIRGLRQTLNGLGLSIGNVKEVLNAYMTGLKSTYYISTAAAACAFLSVLGLRWRKIKKAPNNKSP